MEFDRLGLWNSIDSVFRWIKSICGTHRFGLQNSINSVSDTNPSPGVLTPPSRAAPHCPEHAQCNNHPVKAHATLVFFVSQFFLVYRLNVVILMAESAHIAESGEKSPCERNEVSCKVIIVIFVVHVKLREHVSLCMPIYT